MIASRLSDADPSLEILVIERGQDNYDMPMVVHPAMLLFGSSPGATTAIHYTAKKNEHTANRELAMPSGGVLGGGSSVNYLTYSRPQRSDFDSWGVKGWGGEDMLPYLKKVSGLLKMLHSY